MLTSAFKVLLSRFLPVEALASNHGRYANYND
jgi:hypothetical protein